MFYIDPHPISIVPGNIQMRGMGTNRRDLDEDDCEAWDPFPNISDKGRDCPGDGHYRCRECARMNDARALEV